MLSCKFLGSLRQVHYLLPCLVALLLPNIALIFSPYLGTLPKLLNIFLPLGLWLLVLSLGRKPGRTTLVFLPLMLMINCVQLVLLSIFEGAVISVDLLLSLFSASEDEAGELLGGLVLPIVAVLLIYALFLLIAIRSWRADTDLSRRERRAMLFLSLLLCFLSLPISLWAKRLDPSHSIRADIYPLNVYYNAYIAGQKLGQLRSLDQTSVQHDYQALSVHDTSEREVYVFFLGETSRAYNHQLYGYPRATNPRLAGRDTASLLIYKDVTTQSNTTSKSAPILLSPADAEHSHRLPHVKGILSAMKQAGFYTVFISNQPANRSFLDHFAYEADRHYRIRDILRSQTRGGEVMRPIYDADMLPFLDEVLREKHQKLFVILHAYGAHWNYRDRYPRSFAYFLPDDALVAHPREKERLINAYDNAIRYTDYLLDETIQRLEQDSLATTALYYTSDHGEDIYDDERERILHSSPSISYYQVHIPSILWLSSKYQHRHPAKVQAARENRDKAASSRSNLHTLLELAGVQSPERCDSLSLLSPHYREGLRTYLNDRYECVPLYRMLQDAQDIALWRKMKLKDLNAY